MLPCAAASPASKVEGFFNRPIESCVHAEIPERHEEDGQEVGQVEVPAEPRVEGVKEEDGEADAEPAEGVKEGEAVKEGAASVES